MAGRKRTYQYKAELPKKRSNKTLTQKSSKNNARSYYPFGMTQPGRTFNSSSYNYGYQGSMKDNELYGNGNSYTTKFRQLDVRLGRWLSLDPKGNAFESPYLSMGDNPILNNDVLGDKWDKSNNSQEKAQSFRKSTNKQIDKVDSKISTINKQMSDLDKSSKKYAKLNSQLSNLNARLGELNSSISELDKLKNSSQVYKLKPITPLAGTTTYYGTAHETGETFYKNGKVVMQYNWGDISSKAHELKHGFQFEMGKVSFNRKTGKAGYLHDLTDERKAYRRGSAYNGNLTSPLLNLSNSKLIERGYNISSKPLNSSMRIDNVMYAQPYSISIPTKFDKGNPTFKNSGIDITR